MTIFTNQVGLNIAEEKLQLVEIASRENNFCLENVDEEYFEEPLLVDLKESKFIHLLQNAFNEIDLRKPISSSKLSVSLPLNYFKNFEVPVDKNLTKKDLNEYIDWEFSNLFPEESSKDYSIQKVELQSPNFLIEKRIMVYAVKNDSLRRIHKFCARNNFSLKSVDNSHIASSAFLQIGKYSSNQLSLYIEDRMVSFVLFSNNQLVISKSKAYSNLNEIPVMINSLLEEISQRNLSNDSIEKIYISGNIISKELINSIESSTNLLVQLIYPFNYLKIPAHLAEHKFVIEQSAKFTSAAGMSFRMVS